MSDDTPQDAVGAAVPAEDRPELPAAGPDAGPPSRRRRELSDRWAYTIMAILVVGALAGIVVAVMLASTGGDRTSEVLPESVDRLIPTSGSEILAQATVGIDVKQGYDADLIVDGKEIRTAADGLVRQTGTGLVQFTPGEGRPVTRLESGRNCITAMVWEQTEPRSTAKPVNWCFKVT